MSFCVVQKVGYTRHGRRFFGENLSLTFPVIGWKLSFKILGPNLLERSKLHKYFPGIGIWLVAPWSSWGEVARPGHSLDPGLSRNPEPALAGAGPLIRGMRVLGPRYAAFPRRSGRVSRLVIRKDSFFFFLLYGLTLFNKRQSVKLTFNPFGHINEVNTMRQSIYI